MIGFITQRQSLLPTQKRQDPVSYIGEKHPDLSRQSPINLYTVSIHFFISLQLTNNTAGGMPIPCPRGGWFVWRSPRGLPCASFGESMLVPRSFMAVVYHKFTRRGGVRSEGGRNKLRPSRMGSRHLGGEDGERGAGAQTIAIPALPQRARCALSQWRGRAGARPSRRRMGRYAVATSCDPPGSFVLRPLSFVLLSQNMIQYTHLQRTS